jgi:hypothetical protein
MTWALIGAAVLIGFALGYVVALYLVMTGLRGR